MSLFLCSATFFFWLSTGANLNKLPIALQQAIEPLADSFSKSSTSAYETPSNNDEQLPSTSPSEVVCQVGLTFDPVLNACVQSDSSTSQENEITSLVSTQSHDQCPIELTFDPVLGICADINVTSTTP